MRPPARLDTMAGGQSATEVVIWCKLGDEPHTVGFTSHITRTWHAKDCCQQQR